MEVIMSACRTLTCAPHHDRINLRGAIARRFGRIRIRRDWKRRSKISPALLDDIGLPPQQAGCETAGFFWHV
jgi:uncharacterized protein YjiS (DUF1127 family)